MITAADLLEHVGSDESECDYAEECVETADALVTVHVGPAAVPTVVLDRATILVAAEVYYKKDAPGGIQQGFDEMGNMNPMRLSRDPMRAAYPLLAPFMGGAFA